MRALFVKRCSILVMLFSVYLFPMENPKRFYVLTAPCYDPGFFSVFNTVVGCLYFYEQARYAGLRLDFEDQGRYYDERHGPNWWEYYFEPLVIGSDEGAVIEKFPTYKKIIFSLTSEWKLSRKKAFELINKYIKLKPHIQEKIQDFIQQHFKDAYVIGVHYRGTDKKSEAPVVPYEEAYQKINKAFVAHAQENPKIFIATDDALFLQFMKDKLPDKIIATDALRSSDGKPVHGSWGETGKNKNYKKGKDAVIDCILLSKCQLLIKTASNLSDCSMQFNPDMPVIHLNKSYSE